jgi:hypothetical protein
MLPPKAAENTFCGKGTQVVSLGEESATPAGREVFRAERASAGRQPVSLAWCDRKPEFIKAGDATEFL